MNFVGIAISNWSAYKEPRALTFNSKANKDKKISYLNIHDMFFASNIYSLEGVLQEMYMCAQIQGQCSVLLIVGLADTTCARLI